MEPNLNQREERSYLEFIDISDASFHLSCCCSSRNLICLLITNRKTPLPPGTAPHPEPRPVAPGPLCRMWVFFPRPGPLQSYSAWLFTTHISAVNCTSIFLPASPLGGVSHHKVAMSPDYDISFTCLPLSLHLSGVEFPARGSFLLIQ